jgi:ABC-type multidrug transport system ATPase subunit
VGVVPHGAGKTTTVQIMSTLVHADGGEVRVAAHDVAGRVLASPIGGDSKVGW